MKVTYNQLKRMVTEQLESSEEYKAIKSKRERQSRSNKARRSIIGNDLCALANGVTEAVLPIVLNSFDGEVLKEGIDLKALVQKLRKEIYQKILATISDIEGAKKGRYARNADER